MAYTVLEAYEKTVEEADKMGSDLLTLPVFLSKFRSIATEFVAAKAAEIEKTQQVTTDIRELVVTTKRPLIIDPSEPFVYNATIPNNYMERIRVNVQYSDFLTARQPQLVRYGELDDADINPNKKATKDYPIITQYGTTFAVKTDLTSLDTIKPANLILTYIKRPTLGKATTDVIIDLNDTVVNFLISRTASDYMLEKGDPRAASEIQWTETFRKKQ